MGREGFLSGSSSKESIFSVEGMGLVPGSGLSLGTGHGNPLQYSCLENHMNREVWRATVHRVAKSQTQLSDGAWMSMHTVLPYVLEM